LKAFIEEQPHVYRDEMVDFIAEQYDVDVSLITISRTLQKERISRKKVGYRYIAFLSFIANFSYKE
jgi:hypothetical protein